MVMSHGIPVTIFSFAILIIKEGFVKLSHLVYATQK